MSTCSLIEAAFDYARRHWPVFPCEPRGKRPLGRLAPHGLHDATTDLAVIEHWWAVCPTANIGVRTGVVVDVLDIDGADGQAALIEVMAADEGKRLGAGPWSYTGGGGDHGFYLPTGEGNRAGLLTKVDWRGAGGYVIVPPSVHPNGERYEWFEGPDTPLEPAPAWLLDLVRPAAPARPAVGDSGGITSSAGAYARAALEREVGRLLMAPVGTRNDALNRAAFSLGQLVGAGALDAREVVEALAIAAERIGLAPAEIAATIQSGLNRGMADPRRLSA